MKDLISVDHLSDDQINQIHLEAEKFFKNPNQRDSELRGKILINFFFENSTRTRMSFEAAAKRMGAHAINLDVSLSSLKKGESIIDTAKTINAMRPDFVVIRHSSSGIVSLLKQYIDASLINAGDGTNEHPSQALLDSFVIKQHKKKIAGLKIAICGDVLHSRVARSNIKLLTKLGAKINVITAPTLMPRDFQKWLEEKWQIKVFCSLEEGIKNADVIMMLRIQQERMIGCCIPSLSEYFRNFGLTHEKLKLAPNAIVLHPGPINRDVEISSALADDKNISMILEQVEAGVAVRQSILKLLS
jgi:aspartate carbamoyltransferase catalytic subunit